MRIEMKFKLEMRNRRVYPYPLKRPCIKPKLQNILQPNLYHCQQNKHPSAVNLLINTAPNRACSWTDSDSATEESGDENNNCFQSIQPPPQPSYRTRISHTITATRQEMNRRREHEANAYIIGILIDFRRFSTPNIQNFIDRDWDSSSETTVIGRDDDRYLIFIESEEDREKAFEQSPWSFEGAMFAAMAERLVRAAGEVIGVDWEDVRPRNIRFMRVRIAIHYKLPLAPGCHSYNFCPWSNAEIERMISERMEQASDRYGYPIIQDPRNFLFSNRMKAFLNRASRRNARLNARPSGTMPAELEYQQNAVSQEQQNRNGEEEMVSLQDQSQDTDWRATDQENQDQVQTQLESLILRDHHNNHIQPQGAQVERENTAIGGSVGETEPAATEVLATPETLEIKPEEHTLEDNMAATYAELQDLELEIPNQTEILQVAPLQMIMPDPGMEPFHYNQQTAEPLPDPRTAFDESVARLEQLEQRYERGFNNLADLEDIQYSLNREHARFEYICDEMIRQSHEMLQNMQNRHNNDPSTQPGDNGARWISIGEDGVVYTNDRLVLDLNTDVPKTSSMAERRVEESRLTRRETVQFELNLQLEEGKLENVGGSLSCFNMVQEQKESQDMIQGTSSGITLGSGEEVNPRSPSFICTINEEDLVSAFIRDTPSPDPPPIAAEEPCGAEEGTLHGRASKRKRDGSETNSEDEKIQQDLSGNRRIRRRSSSQPRETQTGCSSTPTISEGPQLRSRQKVWEDLKAFKSSLPTEAEWIVLGGFNQVLKTTDKVSETSSTIQGAEALQDCLNACHLAEIKAHGAHFTWCNNRGQGNRTWERLDRAFANPPWLRKFEEAEVVNLPVSVSDHGPLILHLEKRPPFRIRPYRFEIMWTTHPQCRQIIQKAWESHVHGSAAFKLARKLTFTKSSLRDWNKNVFGNVRLRKKELEKELEELQSKVDNELHSTRESIVRSELERVLEQEQILWMQKSRTNWIKPMKEKLKRLFNKSIFPAFQLNRNKSCPNLSLLKK
ncbi:Endonuclease/exonuclease/phosphatase [Corchorus olitorius]|uniref:Endonuclease/exonuclease/phosphatase n=1 Tax=Corchorus olitorius TaxID=93759 RepID=A0A1R3I8P8_9ROSI|nr:Endonuclease/exonuclease/phosphatase [Corchorus olitorius]